MSDFRPETTTAIAAVRAALEIATRGTGEVHTKVGRDVVTDTDVAIEDHLRESLTSAFAWPVIGEERGGEVPDDNPYWLVDPICGTRNFASGIPLFAVNAAMVEAGIITVGVMGDASTGQIFVAEIGAGAWAVSASQQERLAATSSSGVVNFDGWPDRAEARAQAARAFEKAVCNDRFDVRSFSTTLGLGYLAHGQIAGQVLFSTPALHWAAGALLASEAGAVVTTLDGSPWTVGSDSLIAGADHHVHDFLLRLCRWSADTTAP